MADLFNRAVRIVAGSLLIEGLRVQFKIKKTSRKEPNTAEVTIFNLSEQSRAGLKRGAKLIVEAGYSTSISQLFSGDARLVDHAHEGPSWLTKIQCGDGERAYRYAVVNESFIPGTSVADVFARVADSTGLDVADAVRTVRATIKEQFTQGYTAFGRGSLEIDRLLKGRGIEWSIQDGRLQVLLDDTATRDSAVLLSPDTGLVGSPEHGSPETKKKPQVLKVKSLLQPSLRPGRRVRVESEAITGDFRVLTVTHQGDTHGGDFYSECECVPA